MFEYIRLKLLSTLEIPANTLCGIICKEAKAAMQLPMKVLLFIVSGIVIRSQIVTLPDLKDNQICSGRPNSPPDSRPGLKPAIA
jgi:hypothetical protein